MPIDDLWSLEIITFNCDYSCHCINCIAQLGYSQYWGVTAHDTTIASAPNDTSAMDSVEGLVLLGDDSDFLSLVSI